MFDRSALVWRPRSDADHAWARRAVRRGDLQRILPNVYAPGAADVTVALKAAAVCAADPAAVITGAASAHLLWWPELPVSHVSATRAGSITAAAGFRWEQRVVPGELVADRPGLRIALPALSVLDLIPTRGGNAIDEALRRRACSLDDLWSALAVTPGRPGNRLRRLLLHDSRDQPWSEAERALHRHYRACGLPFAYGTNVWVSLADGRRTALDFALPELRLAFEADGYAWHGERRAFEYDRDRDSDLAAQGWQVVRLTAAFLEHEPGEVRRRLRAIVLHRAALLDVPVPATGHAGARRGTPRGGARR